MSLPIYKIANWSSIYENNRTRELKSLSWVPFPNSHDGDGYTALMAQKNAEALLGAFVVIVQVASKCDPRGTLLRDGAGPHNAASIARMTRFSEKTIQQCLDVCCDPEIGWIILENSNENGHPAPRCDNPAVSCGNPAGGCLEGKGKKEGKEQNGEVPAFYAEARIILHWLNEKSGSHFREVDANLSLIAARLKSTDGDVEGVKKMVTHWSDLWVKDERMNRYLQPSTLFGVENFEKYYGARNRTSPGAAPTSPRRNEEDFLPKNLPDSPI